MTNDDVIRNKFEEIEAAVHEAGNSVCTSPAQFWYKNLKIIGEAGYDGRDNRGFIGKGVAYFKAPKRRRLKTTELRNIAATWSFGAANRKLSKRYRP